MDVLSKERPNAIELMGKNLVVWYNEGTWICFEDLCPHRLAPLSGGLACAIPLTQACMHACNACEAGSLHHAVPAAEGRVEHGTLQCAYVSTPFCAAAMHP